MKKKNSKIISISESNLAARAPLSTGSSKGADIFCKGLLSLFESRSTGHSTYPDVAKLLSLYEKATAYGTVVQNSHEVIIDLENCNYDAVVTFVIDIANFGQNTLTSRAHRFWFKTAQENIGITAKTERGIDIPLSIVESSPHYCEIEIHFPDPLEPADRLKYKLQYSVKNAFQNSYYDVHTRSITSLSSLKLFCPYGYRFGDSKVTREGADGQKSARNPLISRQMEGERELLFWQQRKLNPGDQFRTSWSLIKL